MFDLERTNQAMEQTLKLLGQQNLLLLLILGVLVLVASRQRPRPR